MPRNGSGTYASPAGQPVVTGTVIDSTVFNANTADVATALTNSVAKNGETTPTANLPMGGFKHTGVADGTARTQYTSIAQAQDSTPTLIAGIAGVDTITGSPTIAVAAYATGQVFRFAPAGNNTGAATINVSGLGAKSIVKGATGVALVAGDLVTGVIATIAYNGTSFYLQNPATAGTILAPDGLVGTPSYSFALDPDTGLYRIGANSFGLTTGGALAVEILDSSALGIPLRAGALAAAPNNQAAAYIGVSTSALTGTNGDLVLVPRSSTTGSLYVYTGNGGAVTQKFGVLNNGQALASDGLVGTPGISFLNDQNTGFYRQGADNVRISAGGIDIWGFANAAGTALNQPFGLIQAIIDGSAATPLYSFNSDPDTGIYRVGANNLGIATNGIANVSFNTTWGLQAFLPIASPDGTVSLPGYSFTNDSNTGFYRVAADNFAVSSGGTTLANFLGPAATGLPRTTFITPAAIADGTVAQPSLILESDSVTGWYKGTGSSWNFSSSGTNTFRVVPLASGSAQVADTGGTLQPVGFRNIPVSSTTTTLAIGDVGKCIPITAAINIPISVFAAGDVVSVYNDTGGALNITISAGTLRLVGTATTGTRSLAQRGMCTLWFRTGGATPEVIASGNVS